MTTAARPPAVVVSGHTMALAVVRALGEAGVPVAVLHYDARDMAQASRHVVADIRVPHPLHDEAGFIEAVMEQGRRFAGGVLIPASDESTVAVSRHKQRLKERYVVACPEWEVTERFIDKAMTHALASESGVSIPRTLVPRDPGEAADAGAEIGFPLLLKPAQSHLFYEQFRRKMFRVETPAELASCYLRSREAGLSVIVQEIIPGPDSSVVNYNAYIWDSTPPIEFTARQLRKAPPHLGSPRIAISERISEVVEPGRRILRAMGFYGFACTEFKQDERDGTFKLLEVNGRHNLSGILALRCGVNFPLIQYRHLAEGVTPLVGPSRSGVYWTDVFRDVGYSVAYLRDERLSPSAYLAPYARRHCDAILDRGDLGPFWARLRYLVGNARSTAMATSGAALGGRRDRSEQSASRGCTPGQSAPRAGHEELD